MPRHALGALALACLSAVSSIAPTDALAHDRSRGRARRVAAASPRPAAPAVDEVGDRRGRLLTAFSRGSQLRRCWDRAVLTHPTLTDRSLAVTLHVDDQGRTMRVDVRDPEAPDLAACLVRAGLWLPWVGPGEAFQASTTVTFNRGG